MEIKKSIDLRGVCCPINFVKAKLALEDIGNGEILEIILDEGEPILNVPRSLKEEGHVIKKVFQADKYFRVHVVKG
ncbi:sulfurtransferase TusA family protein [Pelotomaculum propionicicum]|uniref:sulfurtransferase TusA family protein n=1 Tax=Pelotomaculum propionicicum TaxID=258475 RepID=UPI003B813C0C